VLSTASNTQSTEAEHPAIAVTVLKASSETCSEDDGHRCTLSSAEHELGSPKREEDHGGVVNCCRSFRAM
jgi:hypothetical protein